jgi:mannose-1-phosphate guanylyltransferase
MFHGRVKGIILAGGQGTRLRPLSYYFQKCMIPVGHIQKPILEYIIRLFQHHGITDVSMLVGYKHEQIVNYFNSGDRFGVKISYVLDHDEYQGSGGSVLHFHQNTPISAEDTLVIYYGDIISNIDLQQMLTEHHQNQATATLALTQGYQVRVGIADIDGHDITQWREKPTLDLYAGIGIMTLNGTAMTELNELYTNSPTKVIDIMSHFVPYLLQKKRRVKAYVTDAFWYDVGSTERYEKLENSSLEKALPFIK